MCVVTSLEKQYVRFLSPLSPRLKIPDDTLPIFLKIGPWVQFLILLELVIFRIRFSETAMLKYHIWCTTDLRLTVEVQCEWMQLHELEINAQKEQGRI